MTRIVYSLTNFVMEDEISRSLKSEALRPKVWACRKWAGQVAVTIVDQRKASSRLLLCLLVWRTNTLVRIGIAMLLVGPIAVPFLSLRRSHSCPNYGQALQPFQEIIRFVLFTFMLLMKSVDFRRIDWIFWGTCYEHSYLRRMSQ